MKPGALLIITTSYPEAGDGSEAAGAFVAELADELARTVPVRVLAPGAQAGAETGDHRLRVRRYASPGRPLSLLRPSRPADWPAILDTLRSLRREALALAADGGVAHTFALWALPSGWAAAAVSARFGVPYSLWALGSDIWVLGRLPLVRGVLARTARGAHGCFADGVRLAEDAARITGRPFAFLPSVRADRGDVVERRPGGRRRLLFLGRWHENKGVDLLLDALLQLDDAAWSGIAEFRIAGGGPLESRVRDGVARLQARGRAVRLDGFLAPGQARDALADADVVVIPSRIESIPLVFSDAVRAGCAVVATPVGDLQELVAGEPPCGVVAAEASADAIAAAIVAMLTRPAADFCAGIERRAREFSMARVAASVLAHAGFAG